MWKTFFNLGGKMQIKVVKSLNDLILEGHLKILEYIQSFKYDHWRMVSSQQEVVDAMELLIANMMELQ
jgi:hypothetical protein